tara:strand:- start:492 stop:1109 length:618 start_codon:yes stop_codon:yes gene_type:complete
MNFTDPQIIASIITVAGTFIGVIGSYKYAQRKKADPIVEDAAQSANVYTALNYAADILGADRAYVFQFHNGGHYYSGRGQQKFSCTHEVVGHGISAEHVNSQNHRVSSYHPYIVELLENGFFIHADIEEIKDGAFLRLIEKKGVKSILNVPIKTLNGKIIGILGVDYVKDSMPEIQSESGAQQAASDDPVFLLKNQARAIAGYLV